MRKVNIHYYKDQNKLLHQNTYIFLVWAKSGCKFGIENMQASYPQINSLSQIPADISFCNIWREQMLSKPPAQTYILHFPVFLSVIRVVRLASLRNLFSPVVPMLQGSSFLDNQSLLKCHS